jgi:hypothetical protein
MKLQIRVMDGYGTSGPFLMLCDANGEPLPGQYSTHLTQQVDDISKFTVTFNVDGRDVVLVK